MSVTYTEIAPSPPLAPFVECFWVSRGTFDEPTLNRVLPDGCMDILFDLSEAEGYAVGTMRVPSDVWLLGEVDLLGIRFRPAALPAVLRLPAAELTDTIVSLEEVWSPSSQLTERLLSCPDTSQRIHTLESALSRHFESWNRLPSPALRATELIRRTGGRTTIDSLTDRIAISPRQLERLFREHVGITPKEACRIERFRRAVRLIRGQPHRPIVDVALDCGYFDQAHLTREFRRLASSTPATYRQV